MVIRCFVYSFSWIHFSFSFFFSCVDCFDSFMSFTSFCCNMYGDYYSKVSINSTLLYPTLSCVRAAIAISDLHNDLGSAEQSAHSELDTKMIQLFMLNIIGHCVFMSYLCRYANSYARVSLSMRDACVIHLIFERIARVYKVYNFEKLLRLVSDYRIESQSSKAESRFRLPDWSNWILNL